MNKKRGKVFVGLSGGVDSSVSAALLKEAGFDVTGVFIKVWRPEFMECVNTRDRADSMRAASELGIKWRELDLEKEYKKFVVDYMIDEYSRGKVPNPDVMCNRFVKFGGFFDWAMKEGADFVATGHYAKIVTSEKAQVRKGSGFKTCNLQLATSRDSAKDQTYFLWNIPKKVLTKTLFPIGGYKKPEVRKLAKDFGLSAAYKKDSQGLCFVGKIDLKDFLKKFVKTKIGNVLDESGRKIGKHDGAIFFTLGQRHGFFITEKTPNDRPRYVISKNMGKNTIMVGSRSPDKQSWPHLEKKQVGGGTMRADNANWLAEIPSHGSKILVRVRHGGEKVPVILENADEKSFEIRFKDKVELAPSGQSAVLYSGELCLGGGIIS